MPNNPAITDHQRAVIEGWFKESQTADPGSSGAGLEVTSWTFCLPLEEQWLLVLEMIRLAPDDDCLSSIAAGPLEGLLGRYGDQLIGRVEEQAVKDHQFAKTLTHVNQNLMSDEVYERVKTLQASVTEPLQVKPVDQEKAAELCEQMADMLDGMLPELGRIVPDQAEEMSKALEHLQTLSRQPPPAEGAS